MELILVFYHVCVLGMWSGLLVNFLINRQIVPRPQPLAEPLADAPLVSMLVPARNEEAGIERCLRSLQQQDYAHCEIILLDDRSEDATAEIARRLGFAENGTKHRLLTGAALPAGWVGKPWACHQLSQAARGEYLLFTDADTDHAPGSLQAVMQVALANRSDLLTLWPRQETGTWSEQWIIPLLYVAAAGALPHWLFRLAQRRPWARRLLSAKNWRTLGAANGQYVLFRRAAYERMGGHAAVAAAMVEDMSLGRLFASQTRAGMVLQHCDGLHLVRTRMYRNFPQLWEGFTKNAWPAFEGKWLAFAGSLLVQILLVSGPFFLLFCAPRSALLWSEVALIYLVRALLAWHFRSSWQSVLAHPLAGLLGTAIALNSCLQSHRGGVTWKGRSYPVGSGRPPC